MRRLRILTWHIHGGYLNTLTRLEHDWYLPVKPGRGITVINGILAGNDGDAADRNELAIA
jgi:hypothetical protein